MKFKFICIKFVEGLFGVFGWFFFRKYDQDLQTVRTKGKSSIYLSICLWNTAGFDEVLYLLTKDEKDVYLLASITSGTSSLRLTWTAPFRLLLATRSFELQLSSKLLRKIWWEESTLVATFILLSLSLSLGIKSKIKKQNIENREIHKKKRMTHERDALSFPIGKNESLLCVRAKWKKDQP